MYAIESSSSTTTTYASCSARCRLETRNGSVWNIPPIAVPNPAGLSPNAVLARARYSVTAVFVLDASEGCYTQHGIPHEHYVPGFRHVGYQMVVRADAVLSSRHRGRVPSQVPHHPTVHVQARTAFTALTSTACPLRLELTRGTPCDRSRVRATSFGQLFRGERMRSSCVVAVCLVFL